MSEDIFSPSRILKVPGIKVLDYIHEVRDIYIRFNLKTSPKRISVSAPTLLQEHFSKMLGEGKHP
jgi:hypothetical protein